ASGSRVVRAGDDAAGFAIAESLRGQLGGTKQAKFNAESATSLVQTAEGGLNEQNNILVRMRELAVYAASDTIGDTEREYLDTEFQQLSQEFDRIAKTTRYGNKQLLTGSGEEFEFQVGAYQGEENVIRFRLDANTTGSDTGISGLEVADQDAAVDTLAELDEAISKISGVRATFGAMQSRFQHAIDALAVQSENLAAARGHIVDVDMAEEVSKLTQAQILQSAGISVIAQANSASARAMQLLAS
ncbi:MAG TPA: flagellin, partial [Bdellovibrionales bacterium]|nr:flagellin [Bdellovibrionales bacterium]